MNYRIKYSESAKGLEVQITSKRRWLFLIYLGSVFLVWSMFGIIFFVPFILGKTIDVKTSTVIFLIIWIYAEFETGLAFFWNAFGKEIIKISDSVMTIAHDLFGIRLKKSFQIYDVKHLRTVGFYGSMHFYFLGLTGGSIAFDYKGKTHRIGIQLEENEAREVVEKLGPFFPNPESHI